MNATIAPPITLDQFATYWGRRGLADQLRLLDMLIDRLPDEVAECFHEGLQQAALQYALEIDEDEFAADQIADRVYPQSVASQTRWNEHVRERERYLAMLDKGARTFARIEGRR